MLAQITDAFMRHYWRHELKVRILRDLVIETSLVLIHQMSGNHVTLYANEISLVSFKSYKTRLKTSSVLIFQQICSVFPPIIFLRYICQLKYPSYGLLGTMLAWQQHVSGIDWAHLAVTSSTHQEWNWYVLHQHINHMCPLYIHTYSSYGMFLNLAMNHYVFA